MSGDSIASTVDYFGSTVTVTCPRPYQQQYFAGLYHDKSFLLLVFFLFLHFLVVGSVR